MCSLDNLVDKPQNRSQHLVSAPDGMVTLSGWRRLYVEGRGHLSEEEQRGWRQRLRRMPIDPAFLIKLNGWYRALPKRTAGSAALSDSMIGPRASRT
jgi:hypothetical protein